MPVITLNLSALAVAVLYYAWRDGYRANLIKHKVLCERVAYLVWSAAQHAA